MSYLSRAKELTTIHGYFTENPKYYNYYSVSTQKDELEKSKNTEYLEISRTLMAAYSSFKKVAEISRFTNNSRLEKSAKKFVLANEALTEFRKGNNFEFPCIIEYYKNINEPYYLTPENTVTATETLCKTHKRKNHAEPDNAEQNKKIKRSFFFHETRTQKNHSERAKLLTGALEKIENRTDIKKTFNDNNNVHIALHGHFENDDYNELEKNYRTALLQYKRMNKDDEDINAAAEKLTTAYNKLVEYKENQFFPYPCVIKYAQQNSPRELPKPDFGEEEESDSYSF